MPDIQHNHEIEDIINLKNSLDDLSSNSVNPDISLKEFVEGTFEEFVSDYVETVEAYSFYKLTSLKKVVLNSAKKIETYAFNGCTALETLVLGNETEICILENKTAFIGSSIASGTGSIYVPAHLLTAYKEDEMWSTYVSCFKPFGEVERVMNGEITELYDESIEVIRSACFREHNTLFSVDFPNLVTVEDSVFQDCTKLKSIDMPNVTSLGDYALSGCSALETIIFPRLTTVGNSVFQCKSLKNIDLPVLSIINGSGFAGIDAERVCLPSLSKVTGHLFNGCPQLKIVDLPVLENIPKQSFRNNSVLNTVILRKEDSICTLGNANAFSYTPYFQGGTGGVVLVPSALVETYKTAANWSTLVHYGTCVFLPLEEYTVDGTTTGEIDWAKLNTPWQTKTNTTTGISVEGEMPLFTRLSVSSVATENLNLDTIKYPLGQNTIAYDVSLIKDGEKYQHNGEMYVTIPESLVPFNFAAGYVIYNVCGDNVEVRGPIIYTGGFINMPFENEIGTLIYSDVFPTASNESFEAMFSKNNVTLYEKPFESAKTHKIENGLDITIYPEFSYTDTNGVTWCEFYNDNLVNEGDPEYLYVKVEDTEKILVDGPM